MACDVDGGRAANAPGGGIGGAPEAGVPGFWYVGGGVAGRTVSVAPQMAARAAGRSVPRSSEGLEPAVHLREALAFSLTAALLTACSGGSLADGPQRAGAGNRAVLDDAAIVRGGAAVPRNAG